MKRTALSTPISRITPVVSLSSTSGVYMQDYRITMDLCSSDLNAPLAAYNADQCEAFNSAASMPLRGCTTTETR